MGRCRRDGVSDVFLDRDGIESYRIASIISQPQFVEIGGSNSEVGLHIPTSKSFMTHSFFHFPMIFSAHLSTPGKQYNVIYDVPKICRHTVPPTVSFPKPTM